jgi:cytochrome c oxidase cbb3-type subunit 4
MDAGFLRGLYTLFMFIVFIGIVWWAWSSRRKGDFEEAANLPLENDNLAANGAGTHREQEGADQS